MFAPLPDVPEAYRNLRPRFPDATDLVAVGVDFHGRPALLESLTAQAWIAMRDTAASQGAKLLLISAFRSFARQTEIVRRKRELGQSWDDILKVNAFPGFSEHHTGRAIDLASPRCPRLQEGFEHTPEFIWLNRHAGRFGFSLSYPRGNSAGVAYEPWHWCRGADDDE